MNVPPSIKDRYRKSVSWLGGQEPFVLIAVLLSIFMIWGFIALTEEVLEGETQAFDKWVVRSVRNADDPSTPIGPLWVQELGRDATALGGQAWLLFFILAIAGYLWIDRKVHMMWFLLGASSSGWLLSFLLKGAFQRPRPDIVPHLSHVSTSSFPSAHSMNSAVVYLTLAVLIAATLERRGLKIYVLIVALVMTMIVGVSRVYLGVHYPSDVLAGWTAGLVWALLCWLLAHWLQERGQVEQAGAETEPKVEHPSDR